MNRSFIIQTFCWTVYTQNKFSNILWNAPSRFWLPDAEWESICHTVAQMSIVTWSCEVFPYYGFSCFSTCPLSWYRFISIVVVSWGTHMKNARKSFSLPLFTSLSTNYFSPLFFLWLTVKYFFHPVKQPSLTLKSCNPTEAASWGAFTCESQKERPSAHSLTHIKESLVDIWGFFRHTCSWPLFSNLFA